MPIAAVKPELPPEDLRDRNEGWGTFGSIRNYPAYKDNSEWPATIERNNALPTEQPETSDGQWYRNGELI